MTSSCDYLTMRSGGTFIQCETDNCNELSTSLSPSPFGSITGSANCSVNYFSPRNKIIAVNLEIDFNSRAECEISFLKEVKLWRFSNSDNFLHNGKESATLLSSLFLSNQKEEDERAKQDLRHVSCSRSSTWMDGWMK